MLVLRPRGPVASDLIFVTHRKNYLKNHATTTTCLEVSVELLSGWSHLSLRGRLDVEAQWEHEDTPALHRLGGRRHSLNTYMNDPFSPSLLDAQPSAASPL